MKSDTNSLIRVLMITSEWPTPERPNDVPYLVQQVKFLRRAGVDVNVFSFRGAKRPINYFKAWRRLRKHLDPERYNLVHAQFGQAGLLPWPKRLPFVVTFHGCDILGDKDPEGRVTLGGRILRWLCRLQALSADAVIIVSNQMQKYLSPSVKPHLLPTGVDLDSLPSLPQQEARLQLGLPPDEKLILFVGDPENHEKRYYLAKQAVDILNKTLPAKLVVAWKRPHRDIFVFMNACDVLVVSSLQEGSPTIVKEALACNLPIVSVPVGDVPERLQEVEGCEVCADDHPETIAASLELVLRRGERINGREVMKDLDEKVLATRLINIYHSVLKNNPAGVN